MDEKTREGLPTSSTRDKVLGGQQQEETPLGEGQERDPIGGVSRHPNSSTESGAEHLCELYLIFSIYFSFCAILVQLLRPIKLAKGGCQFFISAALYAVESLVQQFWHHFSQLCLQIIMAGISPFELLIQLFVF